MYFTLPSGIPIKMGETLIVANAGLQVNMWGMNKCQILVLTHSDKFPVKDL